MKGNSIFATRRKLPSAIHWLNQELTDRVIFSGAAACDYVERELKRTSTNLKPMLIERFNEMVDELIGTNSYSRVLRIYRKK